MSEQKNAGRHPFLDDLSENVVLTTNVMNENVVGKENVLRVVGAAGKIYKSQTTTYFEKLNDGKTLLEYDAAIVGGRTVHAVVVVDWNKQGAVSHLNIGFSPLGGALSFAAQLGELLPHEQRLAAL